MISLILAIGCSSLISILMRASEDHVKNSNLMLAGNYAICTALSGLLLISGGATDSTQNGLPFAILLGTVEGVFYIAALLLYQISIRSNGVVMSATYMKLGVLVPTIMAIAAFHEKPELLQLVGFVLSISAIILMNMRREDRSAGSSRSFVLLLILLIASGTGDSLTNIYARMGNAAYSDYFLLLTFAVALILAVLLMIRNKEQFVLRDAIWGVAIGIPNYFSARFLLGALGAIPAIIVYPVYNIMTIMIVALSGVLMFRERLTRSKWTALAMIAFAIAALSV